VSFLAAVIAIWQFAVPAFYGAAIYSTGSDPNSPFKFPFAVTNESWLLPMADVVWECRIVKMEIPNAFIDDFHSLVGGLPEVPPNGTFNLRC
jgi:hypothetical protein